MRDIAVVIPARLNSTRIKHKMLMKFDDEPLIRLVFDKVRMMGFDTFVATDSKRIAKHIPNKWCIMTGKADKNIFEDIGLLPSDKPVAKKHTAVSNPPYDPDAHLDRRDDDEEKLKALLTDLIRSELKKLSKK